MSAWGIKKLTFAIAVPAVAVNTLFPGALLGGTVMRVLNQPPLSVVPLAIGMPSNVTV
jgi:hypothetical protein